MGTRLYVGNLPYAVTELDLRDLFGSIGTVTDAKIVTDRETGRPRGFGFVEMSTEDEARKAIEEVNGRDVQGRQVAVKEAEDRRGGGGGGGGGGVAAAAADTVVAAVAAADTVVAAAVVAVAAAAVAVAAAADAVAGRPSPLTLTLTLSPHAGRGDAGSPPRTRGARASGSRAAGDQASSFMPCIRRALTRAACRSLYLSWLFSPLSLFSAVRASMI